MSSQSLENGVSSRHRIDLTSLKAVVIRTEPILREMDSAGLCRLPSCQAGCSAALKAPLDLWAPPTLLKAQTIHPPPPPHHLPMPPTRARVTPQHPAPISLPSRGTSCHPPVLKLRDHVSALRASQHTEVLRTDGSSSQSCHYSSKGTGDSRQMFGEGWCYREKFPDLLENLNTTLL